MNKQLLTLPLFLSLGLPALAGVAVGPEHLLEMAEENLAIHQQRGGDFCLAQCRQKGGTLPMTVRDRAPAALTAGTPAMQACQLGVEAGFINKDPMRRIPSRLLAPPQGGDPNRNVQPIQTARRQLCQGQIRLGLDPALPPPIMGGQPRLAITANLFGQAVAGAAMLVPKTFDPFAADTVALAHFTGAGTALPGCNDPFPQILTPWAHRFFLPPKSPPISTGASI
jgi:hypothetical protein